MRTSGDGRLAILSLRESARIRLSSCSEGQNNKKHTPAWSGERTNLLLLSQQSGSGVRRREDVLWRKASVSSRACVCHGSRVLF